MFGVYNSLLPREALWVGTSKLSRTYLGYGKEKRPFSEHT